MTEVLIQRDDSPPPGRGARRSLAAPVVAVVAVVAVVLAVVAVTGSLRGGSDAPPPLALASGRGGEMSDAASASLPGGGYRLQGTLPDDGPDEGRVHTLPRGSVPQEEVTRLARALGVDGPPQRHEYGWEVTLEPSRLDVNDEGSWHFGRAFDHTVSCIAAAAPPSDGPVAAPGGAAGEVPPAPPVASPDGPAVQRPAPDDMPVSCSGEGGTLNHGAGAATSTDPSSPDSSSTDPSSPDSTVIAEPVPDSLWAGAPVSEQEARAAAAPLLEALGLRDADVSVATAGSMQSVVANPVIDGLPTLGWATRVEVGPDGSVAFASGWVGEPEPGDSYPLISAQQAFEALASGPMAGMPEVLCAPDVPDCGAREMVVTGARYGLALQWAQDGPMLVPAWLFAVQGSAEDIAQIAVASEHLAPDLPLPGDPMPVDPGPGGPGEPPKLVPPAQGGGQPDSGVERQAFSLDGYALRESPMAFVVHWGDSGSCPRQAVDVLVKEGPESVVVLAESNALPETPCTSDYQLKEFTIELMAPLGDRAVIDGASGRELERR